MNELMNHEAVYRTAPATPGLLIIRASDNIKTFFSFLSLAFNVVIIF